LAVAIWCAAVARASPSLAYFLFPLTGHFDSLSTARPSGLLLGPVLVIRLYDFSILRAEPRFGLLFLPVAKAVSDNAWVVRAAALEAIAKRGNPILLPTSSQPRPTNKKDIVRYSAAAAVLRLSRPRPRKPHAELTR
jgi:hypothetical protein